MKHLLNVDHEFDLWSPQLKYFEEPLHFEHTVEYSWYYDATELELDTAQVQALVNIMSQINYRSLEFRCSPPPSPEFSGQGEGVNF